MKIIDTLNLKHLTQLYNLYQNEWWTKDRTLEETQEIVKNSSVVIGFVNDDDDLVAFARVLSDFVAKAIIFDVIVDPRYRKQGLGKKLMDAIPTHSKLQKVKHFELYCLPEMVTFYREYGFEDSLGGLVFMRKAG